MDPSWNELKTQLQEGPFPQKGFNKQLQWQIEEKLESQLFRNKTRLFTIASAGTCMLLLALIISLNWTTLSDSMMSMDKTTEQVIQQNTIQETKSIVANLQSPVKSVLLIGFRTDYQDRNKELEVKEANYSEYRSLMITGDTQNPSKLHIAAEGSSILVPFGQQFWKIGPVTQKAAGYSYQYLTAYPANGSVQQQNVMQIPQEEISHNEKLVFAGNQYVSIIEKNEEKQGNRMVNNEKVWIHKIEQLIKPIHLNLNPVSVQQIMGRQEDDGATHTNWTITRNKGQWIPQIAEAQSIDNEATSFTLRSIASSLPESVVSYDKLSSSWKQIMEAQPAAIDAVSSPDGDMIAILTADKLYAYPYIDHEIGPLALQINLKPNETLIMAQWANAQYADYWIEAGKKYLNK